MHRDRSGDAGVVSQAKRRLLEWHGRFSRFNPDSELCRLNADSRPTVPVEPMMRRILATALAGAERTGGLVDPTLVDQIEDAGYAGHFDGSGIGIARLLELAPPRHPKRARDRTRHGAGSKSTREPARSPARRASGSTPAGSPRACSPTSSRRCSPATTRSWSTAPGTSGSAAGPGAARAVHVASPFDDSTLHTFELTTGAVATSGIGRRSWTTPDGRPAHHLLDPATGEPAFTGVVQATALAPTAAEAEILSKAAMLSGPGSGPRAGSSTAA